jgi:ABC-2 type transport system permease protein
VGYIARDTPVEDFEFFTFREYVGVSTALLLFVALTAPDVVCPDRRQRVLPLIFARPLTGADYVVAKVGAIAGIVFGFSYLPQVVLFIGQMFVTSDGALDYFTENAEALWQVPVAVALLAAYYGAVGVAIAATTNRRIVAAVAILALLLVTSTVSAIARGVDEDPSFWSLVNVLAVPLYLRDLVFLGHQDPEGALAGIDGGGAAAVAVYLLVLAVSIGFLLRRYREVAV